MNTDSNTQVRHKIYSRVQIQLWLSLYADIITECVISIVIMISADSFHAIQSCICDLFDLCPTAPENISEPISSSLIHWTLPDSTEETINYFMMTTFFVCTWLQLPLDVLIFSTTLKNIDQQVFFTSSHNTTINDDYGIDHGQKISTIDLTILTNGSDMYCIYKHQHFWGHNLI